MVAIQSVATEIKRGKKRRRKKIETAGQKYNGLPYYMGWPWNIRMQAHVSRKEFSQSLRSVFDRCLGTCSTADVSLITNNKLLHLTSVTLSLQAAA